MRLTCDNDLYFSPFYGTRLLFLLRRLLHFKKQLRSANSYSYTSICTPKHSNTRPACLLFLLFGFTNLKIASDYTSYAMQHPATGSHFGHLPFVVVFVGQRLLWTQKTSGSISHSHPHFPGILSNPNQPNPSHCNWVN